MLRLWLHKYQLITGPKMLQLEKIILTHPIMQSPVFGFQLSSFLRHHYRYYCGKQPKKNPHEDTASIRQAGLEFIRTKEGLYPPFEAHHIPVQDYRSIYEGLIAGEHVQDIKYTVVGRITSIRDASSKLYFIDITQGGWSLQVVASKKRFTDQDYFKGIAPTLRRWDIAEFHGHPGKTKMGELSLFANSIRLLAPCLVDSLPLRNELSNEVIRFNQRYLDLLINDQSKIPIIMRAKVLKYLRQFLDNQGFMEVETPVLSQKVGGANARPFTTMSNALHTEFQLRISPELYLKQLVIGGLERVYEIGKQFRNEGVDRTHNPEFTSCEFYMAYGDYNNLINMTESFISGLCQDIHGKQQITINEQCEDGSDAITINLAPPYRKVPIVSTLEDRLGCGLGLTEPGLRERLVQLCDKSGITDIEGLTEAILLDRLVSHFLEPMCIQPTFLTDFPQIMSPLAKAHQSKAGICERFELFMGGRELCNAYVELNDPQQQRINFDTQTKTEEDIPEKTTGEEYCKALEYGLPPTAGWGIGIDRLLMVLSGHLKIREVLAFSLLRAKMDPNGLTNSQSILKLKE